eukprot:CAMPEP_0179212002 /NCGR_PEP_ID=MMETSP0797-20121207/826_1 /TAXON_ID=47934 /ORGANISM="Dinophysis acuminata, Strain DAEP01" /LENGTH=341 /DNA_ID=CAMNT_0020917491 /DNA_START=87 /DNA_END=1113 /DNA_ORIENTATION=+
MQAAVEFANVAERRQAVLDSMAEAIAASLETGSQLGDDMLPLLLRDMLLEESEDASDEALARCIRLRSDLAVALQRAVAERRGVEASLAGGDGSVPIRMAPPVRVEVRGTAGRHIIYDAFTVGSAPECDIQVYGDSTVHPLHCVVCSLPGGIVVADAWSDGCTSVAQHRGEQRQRAAFVLAHGERATVRVGARTTITVGPEASKSALQAPGADKAPAKQDCDDSTTYDPASPAASRASSRAPGPCARRARGRAPGARAGAPAGGARPPRLRGGRIGLMPPLHAELPRNAGATISHGCSIIQVFRLPRAVPPERVASRSVACFVGPRRGGTFKRKGQLLTEV